LSSERLMGSDKRALLLSVLVGIVGVWFAHHYFFRAFPEASVDFRVSRGEALMRAQTFVSGLGENIGGYRSSIVFDVDDNAKTYLERELGLQQANLLMSSELNIWYWDVRFFRPLQEEEFDVRVSPAGNIVGYEHKIKEARPGASLERAIAQEKAQSFLSGKLGVDLSKWDFLPEEANSNRRPNRLDWSFTWEKHGFRAKDAPYRLEATVRGDSVGGTEEYLQVPEAWKRDFEKLRSGNDTLAAAFTIPYILILAMAVWLAIRLTNRGQTSWRGAILLGGLVAALLFLQNLNGWPLWSASYDTNSAWGSFIAIKLGSALLIAVVTALTITLVLPAAEPLYRASQPRQLQLAKTFTLRGLRSKEFFSAAVVGLSFAAAHIGYVVAFYVVASHFGAWAPQEISYEESVNTLFPWISGAAIGLLASTNEEFTFRLFAIPFFARLTKSRWIAVIVPAFLWGFLHSNYPQEPAYIRGIEIGLIGIVAGLVMLRWGILATLIWHYTVDASLVGLFLIRSNSLYFKISGAVVAAAALAPLAFSGISYLVRGRFEPDEDLLNSSAPVPDLEAVKARPVAAAVQVRRYDALAPAMLGLLALCVVAGGLLAWRLKPESIGDYLKLSANARTARAHADEILRKRGIAPSSYVHTTLFVSVTDPVANEFLRQRVGLARVNEIYATQVPGVLWRVRYFRDSEPEEYAVIIKPDGSLHSVRHTLAEAAPGASLTKDEAVARAEKFLREEKKIDLSQWTEVEANSDKRPKRTDHTLTWQQNAPLDAATDFTTHSATGSDAALNGHAYARIELVVQGDEVTDYRTYLKIPDDWKRKQEELTLPRMIFTIAIPIVFLGGLAITALIIFLKNLRSDEARSIPWRRISRWALWGLAGYAVVFALGNRIPTFLGAYNTAIPLKIMLGTLAIGAILGGPFYYGALAIILAMAWYFAKRAFAEENFPSWIGMPARYYRDALLIGLGGAGALIGLQSLLHAISQHWPTAHRSTEASFGTNFDAFVPAASILGTATLHTLLFTGGVALIAAFIAAQLRATWMRAVTFLLATLALMPNNWGSPADFVKQWLAELILLSVLAFGVRYVMRFNILGCFLVLATTALTMDAAELLGQPDRFYRLNGYAVISGLVVLLAWTLLAWLGGPATNGTDRQPPAATAGIGDLPR
jgi:Type II CAAX prenyl endopeptidase Rce1-like